MGSCSVLVEASTVCSTVCSLLVAAAGVAGVAGAAGGGGSVRTCQGSGCRRATSGPRPPGGRAAITTSSGSVCRRPGRGR
ncbi:hypothetical protein Ae168Ps1_6076c [Pseudonocardia sp. Ae168_Ps1]|nr:hypothetical protein Ae150APs1_6018c [Pseudonocardia sp. Ae150A_Ps1]OLL70611.1 hypothetical protein Ae168Ps1_6076c [Pseudonocardia sp. Ae168_Ps1]OLL89322.1 hypothetical protein Ae356Ps1_6066c [Pseudonocardia sp. Ae356_Ps1]